MNTQHVNEALAAFVLVRSRIVEALDTAHKYGVTHHDFFVDAPVRDAYGPIADLLIELDERGKRAFGEAEYIAAAKGLVL